MPGLLDLFKDIGSNPQQYAGLMNNGQAGMLDQGGTPQQQQFMALQNMLRKVGDFGRGMRSAGAPSRLPVSFGQAMGMGFDAMDKGQDTEEARALKRLQIQMELKKLTQPEYKTLSPGQRMVDTSGNVVAEGGPQQMTPYQSEYLKYLQGRQPREKSYQVPVGFNDKAKKEIYANLGLTEDTEMDPGLQNEILNGIADIYSKGGNFPQAMNQQLSQSLPGGAGDIEEQGAWNPFSTNTYARKSGGKMPVPGTPESIDYTNSFAPAGVRPARVAPPGAMPTQGQGFDAMPSAAKYPGRSITDQKSGQVYVSDGRQWKPRKK